MHSVFLVLVFLVQGGTVNTTTPMPDMETCDRMRDIHMDDLPKENDWGTPAISKPRYAFCIEPVKH